MPISYDFKFATLCGIEQVPLLFVSVIVPWGLKNEENPCTKCLKIIEDMKKRNKS